jgi:hypothetical protein
MNSAEQTVISFLPLARWMAARQIRRGWTQNDYDDFVSCAIMAAQKACERCALPQCVRDTDGGARCPYTFARMSGAILDFMREADPMTRGGRREVKEGKRPPVTLVPIVLEDESMEESYQTNCFGQGEEQPAERAWQPTTRDVAKVPGEDNDEHHASRQNAQPVKQTQPHGSARPIPPQKHESRTDHGERDEHRG